MQKIFIKSSKFVEKIKFFSFIILSLIISIAFVLLTGLFIEGLSNEERVLYISIAFSICLVLIILIAFLGFHPFTLFNKKKEYIIIENDDNNIYIHRRLMKTRSINILKLLSIEVKMNKYILKKGEEEKPIGSIRLNFINESFEFRNVLEPDKKKEELEKLISNKVFTN